MSNDNFSFSGQVLPEHIPELKNANVELIVCCLPDNEAIAGKPFSVTEAAAKEAGIEIVHIPFPSTAMSQAHVDAFLPHLEKNVRTHMYCRSGGRAQNLLGEAQKHALANDLNKQ